MTAKLSALPLGRVLEVRTVFMVSGLSTLALYTTLAAVHRPGRGQSCFLEGKQLHLSLLLLFSEFFCLISLELCLSM